MSFSLRCVDYFFIALTACAILAPTHGAAPAPAKSDAATTRSIAVVYDIPAGDYKNGRRIPLRIQGRAAFIAVPTGNLDEHRRWIWAAPLAMALPDPNSMKVPHEFYIESLLKAGFCVGGVDVGISCGSPKGVEICEEFYKTMVEKYHLNPRVSAIAQSNGGLIFYGWGFRHPQCVDRVFGIYPVTDMSTWPTLEKVCGPGSFPEPELSYGLTVDELRSRLREFNPIDNIEPLAKADVKIFHIHGDKDTGVLWTRNTIEFVENYRKLGGQADYEIYPGRGHGPSGEGGGDPKLKDEIFYHSQRGLSFLLE